MGLISFCGLLTLQVGAAILAAVFFCIAGVMLAANIFDYHNQIPEGWFPFSLVLMIIFALGLIIAGAFMFGSSYSENRSMAIIALIIIIVLICYWLVLCCFSFLSNREHVEGICIDTRCPESFWIGNLRYRRYQIPEEQLEEDEAKKTKDPSKVTDGPAKKLLFDVKNYAINRSPLLEEKEPNENKTPERRFKNSLNADAAFEDNFKNKSEILDVAELLFNHSQTSREELTVKNISIEGTFQKIIEEGRNSTFETDIDSTTDVYDRSKKLLISTTEAYGGFEVYRRDEEIADYYEDDDDDDDDDDGIGFINGILAAFFRPSFIHNRRHRKQVDLRPYPINATDDDHSRYYFGLPMIGAIILFLINLFFLIYSALVMYSWAQELAWAEYYYEEDDPVVVVEDY